MIFALDSSWLAQVSSPIIACVRVSWTPPVPVEVHEPARGPFAIVETVAVTALSSLETTFIIVIFIRLQREDLRNRFIRLAGSSDLHRTTLAMNDAAGRLSRFYWFRPL